MHSRVNAREQTRRRTKFYSEIDASPAPNEKVIIRKKNPKGIFIKARDAIPGKCATTNPAPDKVLFGDRGVAGAE
jgi:hypothetical protein